jgi:hypothetical protein
MQTINARQISGMIIQNYVISELLLTTAEIS